MTKTEAYEALPADAQWSCSFGYPGEDRFSEYYRTQDGKRFEITKRYRDWNVTEVAA